MFCIQVILTFASFWSQNIQSSYVTEEAKLYKPVKEGLLITDVFDTRQDSKKINVHY